MVKCLVYLITNEKRIGDANEVEACPMKRCRRYNGAKREFQGCTTFHYSHFSFRVQFNVTLIRDYSKKFQITLSRNRLCFLNVENPFHLFMHPNVISRLSHYVSFKTL